MKLTANQIQKLCEKVLQSWKAHNIIHFKSDEKKVLETMVALVAKELQREVDLDREVNQMLDQLERSNPGEFQRFKMFQMLKQKLAKEKKVIL